MVFFDSERLIFRQWKETDKKYFAQMNSDSKVMEYFPNTLSQSESDSFADRIIKTIDEKQYGLWAVELKGNQEFIGFIGFNHTTFISDFTPCIEIGWRLGKEFWGLGYATEGAKAALYFGFNRIKFGKILSFTSKINHLSENVMKKIGMQKIGEFDHPNIDKTNKLCQHVLYCIERYPK